MTTASRNLPVRRVSIGGREYDKPWDPACGACRSPWLANIDAMLAEGYSMRQIHKLLAGRPAVPNETILRAHIRHLAEPHRKARVAFEEAAAARGDDTSSAGMNLDDVLQAVVRAGVEGLAHGDMEVRASELLKATDLLVKREASRAGEGVEASAWQAAFMSFFEIVRRHLSPGQWKAFTDDIYASPEIRAVLTDSQTSITPEEVT